MIWFGRFSVPVGLCVAFLLLSGPARAEDKTDRRVAILRALVRDEPLPREVMQFVALRSEPEFELAFESKPQADFDSDSESESERARDPEPGRSAHCDDIPPSERVRWEVRRAVRDASLRYAVPGELIRSVIRQESAYDPRALSPVGAMGLMQLMPATARELGVACPWDLRQNITGGTRYLREMHDRFGSWRLALAAYNAGPTAVVRDRIPGITRIYVRRVLAGWRGHANGA